MEYVCCLLRWPKNSPLNTNKNNCKVRCDCMYQVTLGFLVLLPAILGSITIPVAVVQVLGAVATHVPHAHLLLPGLLRLWRLAVSKNAKHHNRNQSWLTFLSEVLLVWTNHRSSCLAFSVGPPMRFLKNSSLFFSMISSWVKPWLPFSTIFCTDDADLPWSAFTGSAAGAGKVESSGEDWDRHQSRNMPSVAWERQDLPSFLVFLFFLLLCSLPLSPPFTSIIDLTVFWDFSDSLKVRIGAGLRALLLCSASLVVLYFTHQHMQDKYKKTGLMRVFLT